MNVQGSIGMLNVRPFRTNLQMVACASNLLGRSLVGGCPWMGRGARQWRLRFRVGKVRRVRRASRSQKKQRKPTQNWPSTSRSLLQRSEDGFFVRFVRLLVRQSEWTHGGFNKTYEHAIAAGSWQWSFQINTGSNLWSLPTWSSWSYSISWRCHA